MAQEAQGLLWVWPSDDPAAQSVAEATPLPLVPENEDPAWYGLNAGGGPPQWGYTLMPVDYCVAQVRPWGPSGPGRVLQEPSRGGPAAARCGRWQGPLTAAGSHVLGLVLPSIQQRRAMPR